MKMRSEHFQHLETLINEKLEQYPNLVSEYENGLFQHSEKVADLQKRFCFDVLYACDISRWVCDHLYPYLDDTHIYTALKAICPKLTRRY